MRQNKIQDKTYQNKIPMIFFIFIKEQRGYRNKYFKNMKLLSAK